MHRKSDASNGKGTERSRYVAVAAVARASQLYNARSQTPSASRYAPAVLLRTEVTALHGDRTLREITLRNYASGEERRVPTRWLFVCIGAEPKTQWATAIGMVRDDAGYIVTGPDLLRNGARPPRWPLDREPYFLETNIPGVFAAGDVRHGAVQRCASAAGEGAMAVAFVHRLLDGS